MRRYLSFISEQIAASVFMEMIAVSSLPLMTWRTCHFLRAVLDAPGGETHGVCVEDVTPHWSPAVVKRVACP